MKIFLIKKINEQKLSKWCLLIEYKFLKWKFIFLKKYIYIY